MAYNYDSEFNSGRDRLRRLGLLNHPHFSYNSTGDILISYYELNGKPLHYNLPEDNRKTLCIERPDTKALEIRRLTAKAIADGFPKYLSPKGAGAPPYFTQEIIRYFLDLSRPDTIVFTEGELKAAFFSKTTGIPSISFKGISNYKLCNRIKSLLGLALTENIVINYDSDCLRKKNSQFYSSCMGLIGELRRFYKELGISPPNIYINCQNPEQEHKGLDDLLLNVEDSELDFICLKNSNNFLFTKIDLKQPEQACNRFFKRRSRKEESNLYASVLLKHKWSNTENNYLGDILENNNFPLNRFFGHAWHIPTGMGKSTTTLRAAIETGERIIFAAPTQMLVDQLSHKSLDMEIDSCLYYGLKNQGSKRDLFDRVSMGNLPQIIFVTYNSVGCLHDTLKSIDTRLLKTYNLVFDELHNTTTAAAANFQLDVLNQVLDVAPNFKTFTGLTASPLLSIHPLLESLPKIELKISGKPKPTAEIVTAKSIMATTAAAIQASIKKGNIPIVLLNSKKIRLKKLYIELGDNREDFLILNADTKNEAEQQELITKGLLEGKKGIIATTVLKEGISILNTAKFDFIQVGQFHTSISYQFSQRARSAESSHLTIIVSREVIKGKRIKFSIERKAAEYLNKAFELSQLSIKMGTALEIRKLIDKVRVRDMGNSNFAPDFLLIQHALFLEETKAQYSTIESLRIALSKYFQVAKNNHYTNIALSDFTKNLVDRMEEQIKAEREQLFNEALEHLDKGEIITAQLHGNNEYFSKFAKIEELQKDRSKAIEIFRQSKGKDKYLKLARLRLKAKDANFDELKELGNAPKAIQRKFKAGESYCKDKLKAKFLKVLAKDSTINLAPYKYAKRMDKILKILRIFFEVEPKGKDGGKYELKPLPDYFS
jgi:hypothetical protein